MAVLHVRFRLSVCFSVLAVGWLAISCPRPARGEAPGSAKLYCLLVPLDTVGPGAVQWFDVDDAGLLVPRDLYPTGGSGRAGSTDQDLEMDPGKRWLIATNNESNDLTVYSVASDGSLGTVPGSPFPTGPAPMNIAFHPSLDVFYVSHWKDSSVRAFEIGDDGSLTSIDVETSAAPRDLEVDSGGHRLYVVDMSQGVQGYEISDDGTLTLLQGSPFRFPSDRPVELEISADGRHLLVLDLDKGIAAFDIEDSGSLTLVQGSPVSLGEFATVLQITSDYRFAYVGFPFKPEVAGFTLIGGELPAALSTSPFPAVSSVNDLLISPDNRRLYEVTREEKKIQLFSVEDDGSLARVGSPLLVIDPEGRTPNGAILAHLSRTATFLRGDSNLDRSINLTDAVVTLDFLFKSGAPVLCEDGADSNDDGELNLTDGVFLLDRLFRGGQPLPPPGPDGCGSDPTNQDSLSCTTGC